MASFKSDFKKERRDEVTLTNCEAWFVRQSPETRDFIVSKVFDRQKGWKAAMHRTAQKHGLEAGLTSFKDFLYDLEQDPGYLEDLYREVI